MKVVQKKKIYLVREKMSDEFKEFLEDEIKESKKMWLKSRQKNKSKHDILLRKAVHDTAVFILKKYEELK